MYDVKFLNDNMLNEFWAMLGGLLRFVSPFIMIGVAIILAGWLILIIVKTVRKAVGRENDGYQRDDEAFSGDERETYKEKYKY